MTERKGEAMKRKRGFTLIEFLVVIAIIAILAAVFFPVFAQAREAACSVACLSDLKQVGMTSLDRGARQPASAGRDQRGKPCWKF